LHNFLFDYYGFEFWFTEFAEGVVFSFAEGGLSNNILKGGDTWSSYCPLLTVHKKAARNKEATETLAISNSIITLMMTLFML